MAINRYDPFREMLSLRDAMDRLFQESFVRPSGWMGNGGGTMPVPVDVLEDAHSYVVTASLPGWKPEDVNITFQEGTLTISGQYQENPEPEEGKSWHLRERRVGSFSRSFTFPSAVDPDKAEAHFENGVLTLTLPKAESARPRQIKIGAAGAGSTSKPITAGSK